MPMGMEDLGQGWGWTCELSKTSRSHGEVEKEIHGREKAIKAHFIAVFRRKFLMYLVPHGMYQE